MGLDIQPLRKKAGFRSAKAFAEHMGIPVSTYTDWEQGRRTPTLEMAWQLADALGEAMGRYVSIDELAGREWPRSPALDADEAALVDAWRSSNPQGRAAIEAVAASQAGMEGAPEAPASPPGEVVVA